MVGYLLWRVLTGLHDNITLSFMIAGHTKFQTAVLASRIRVKDDNLQLSYTNKTVIHRYKHTKIGGLTDLAAVVNTSANVNTTQLMGTPEGAVKVPT